MRTPFLKTPEAPTMNLPDLFSLRACSSFAAVLLTCLMASPGRAQPSPGQSGQFNRIGSVMTVAEAYTPQAAAGLGGAANLIVDMNNAVAGANVVMQNSGTGLWVENVGYLETSESDPGTLHALLSDLSSWPDVTSFWSSTGAGIIQCVRTGTDDAGLSYECGNQGTLDYEYGAWYVVYAHELGRNCCLEQGDDVGDPNPFICIMLQGYCGGANIAYCSNPSVYYNGVQLLGTTGNDCGQGPLANEGNNARQFALNGPNYQGSKPVVFSGYNPLLTAVHCGGAAVATLSADQRTFAADQNYSGGTAWNANGYGYTVDLSGVTNPAPLTAYQDQRYGNMTYTFTNYLPGANYLVRLHCLECCWSASGQRVFNVIINGRMVLTNFDIYAAAGAQNRAIIKEIMTTANVGGQIVIQFVNVVDNASVSAIEILQGGLYVPVNVTATAGNGQASLSWSPVTGATSYNIKRATVSGGPYTPVGNSAATNYTDNPIAGTTTYYYVVSAVNGGNESFNSKEATVTTPVTVNSDTWLGGAGNNFSTVTNWLYALGSGPVSNSDALVFGSVGSPTPDNDEAGFGCSTITFNPGAQAYTIGGNAFSLGTNSVSPVITVNSANPQVINNAITLLDAASTISTTAGNLTLGGNVTGPGSLTKSGAGTLTLTAAASSLNGGLIVGAGTLNLPAGGAVTSTNTITVGDAPNNAVLNISGGRLSALNFDIGTVSSAIGAVYQNGGSVSATEAGTGNEFQIGNAVDAMGYYGAFGGTLTVNEIGLGVKAAPEMRSWRSAGRRLMTPAGWFFRAPAQRKPVCSIFSAARSITEL